MLFFITQFPSLITLKYPTRLAPSLNIFYTVCGPHTCHWMQLLFYFLVPKLTEPSEKRRRRRRRRRKEKKTSQWGPVKKEEKKKKKKKEPHQ